MIVMVVEGGKREEHKIDLPLCPCFSFPPHLQPRVRGRGPGVADPIQGPNSSFTRLNAGKMFPREKGVVHILIPKM